MRRGMILLFLASVLPGVTGNAIAEEGDDLIILAADHYAHQRWELAATSFKSFLQENPQDVRTADARFYYAESLLQLERYPKAVHEYKKFLEVAQEDDPRHDDASFRMAEAAYLAARHHQAIERFEPFLTTAPRGPRRSLAEAYLAGALLAVTEESKKSNDALDAEERQNLQRAGKLFRTVLEEKDAGTLSDTCRFGLARCNDLMGKSDLAKESYSGLLENTEQTIAAQSHYYLGRLANENGDAKLAATTWEALLKKWPESLKQERDGS